MTSRFCSRLLTFYYRGWGVTPSIVSAEAKIEKYFQRDCSLLIDRVVFTDAIVVIGNTS